MDAQIENAIQIAWDPQSDPSLKSQAFEFLQQLRADPSAWHICSTLFTKSPRSADVVRLVSLEIVNLAVQVQQLDAASLAFLKDSLLDYVRRTYGPGAQDEPDVPSLQNKLTQTLTYLFARLYKSGWETFLSDFLALTASSEGNPRQRDNVRGVTLYLRILGSVHDEIADNMLARQGNEGKRNAELKDAIRERDMRMVVESWQDLLSQYTGRDDAILEHTLKVMAKWVSWIDISLVITQDMLNLLFPLIGRVNPQGGADMVRDAAIEAFTEIAGKKMKPVDKTELISFLNLRQIISELVASPPLSQFRGTHRYDSDLAESVAKLVNVVVTDVVKVLEDGSVGEESRAKAGQHLQDFLPLLLRLFSDEYDEVCSTVIPSLTDILTFLRKVPELPDSYREMLRPIMDAIVAKMRFDETSHWFEGKEAEEEADFLELRKRLQNLQKSVAAVDENLFIDVMSNLVATTLQNLDERGAQMDWRDIDLALHELLQFGELALPNQGLAAKSQPSSNAAERLNVIMRKLVESSIADFPHPAVLLQYMEVCVRYCVFFETNHSYIPRVLENFVRLVHYDLTRFRVRSWYLFHRFVKQLRAQVGNVAETIIQSIADLLPIKAEVSAEDGSEDDMSSDQTDNSADAIFNSQLYLFEAIGYISSTSATPVDKQALYARSVMEPLFRDMENHLEKAKSGDAQAILQIHHVIMALGTLAHGFGDHAKPGHQRQAPDKLVSAEFARAAEAILIALGQLNSRMDIRAACRSAFSKLLNVLGSAVLPQLPQWIEGLLSQSSSKDEMAMFLRLLDQVVYGFKTEISDVLNLLLTPLLQRVFGGLAEPINGTDDEIQLGELRREYLTFLQIILDNDLGAVLVSETNQGFFESIISSVVTLAKTSGHVNMVASRLAFCTLYRIVGVWGGPDVANISANPSAPTGTPTPAIPGFDQFMIERFHPVCFEVLQDPQFNPSKDAQSKQVLNEIAALEQAIYVKTGNSFISHLQSSLFPALGIDGTEFLRCMTTSTDKKTFGNYLQNLIKNRR
ncbi:pre-tRNA nuclear export protein [Pyricularia oryzae]|nr:pre-tRNA nuclear export protein [Pyricularia oryzae]KAI6481988.1 pre-tRNA nuclear export protein [Pyricularia oryzae]